MGDSFRAAGFAVFFDLWPFFVAAGFESPFRRLDGESISAAAR